MARYFVLILLMSGYKERIVIVESEKQLQEHYKIYHSPVDGIWYGRSTIGNTYDGVGTGKVNLFPNKLYK